MSDLSFFKALSQLFERQWKDKGLSACPGRCQGLRETLTSMPQEPQGYDIGNRRERERERERERQRNS
jgi:hypothetical protein